MIEANEPVTALLAVNNIEVVYDSVILAVKGVSLTVPERGIVALLGANGAGKSSTLKAISRIITTERGEITKGHITFQGQDITNESPFHLVRGGLIQVLEGRFVFPHLTVEENLLVPAYVRKVARSQVRQELERIYAYFPRLKERRTSQAGYTSGGEQQMVAIGRALMARPALILLDEPSMGLAPQIVEEIFEIVQDLNRKEAVSFLVAEQNTAVALRYADFGSILERGRVVMSGNAAELSANEEVKEAYLGMSGKGPMSFRETKRYHLRKRQFAYRLA
ncbi:MAG: ABC transporter ATP-binding protein [Nitrospirales bacterium]|nr:ABC transporter ATP-binding protein [Nitrospirales bacterium]